ncbi:ATP-binding protein [Streptomyces sp. NPDC087850]|uniref:ATP-binding protein n=1 Tax=Streptomyces sp. NPDC087850 TaxID=3365809 RepID=UPI003809FF48
MTVVFLLVGLAASGKTSYSRERLEPAGAVRLSVDEVVHERYGRYGVDYPESTYFEKEAPVVAELKELLVRLVAEDQDVVWDHGLWPRKHRDEMKELVEGVGGHWRLLYFPVDRPELLRRLQERNRRGDANALFVSEEALDDFIGRFEVPQGEDEEIIDPDWL